MRNFVLIAAGLAALLSMGEPASARGKRLGRDDHGVATSFRASGGERGPGDRDWTRIDRYGGSTTVITRKMLDDYGAYTMCDALRLVPGVFVSGC